jgi:hypothetical protein
VVKLRQDFQAAHGVEHIVQGKVRGMIVRGMGKCVFRIIPLTNIPLTFLPAFPSSIHPVTIRPYMPHHTQYILELKVQFVNG